MIDPITAWPQIRENAIKALKTGMIWHSLVEQAEYTLAEVLIDSLIIQRADGEQKNSH